MRRDKVKITTLRDTNNLLPHFDSIRSKYLYLLRHIKTSRAVFTKLCVDNMAL